MQYNDQVNHINRILDTDNTILTIYNELINSKKENNLNKYYEYLEYLKIAIEVENKIYEELNLKTEEEIDTFFNIFYFVMENKDYNETDKFKTTERIENYFLYKTYIIPTPSTKNNLEEKTEENVIKILNQASKDHIINLLNELENKIKIESNPYIRKKLINCKYNMIFSNKYIENKLIQEKDIKANTGRKKLIKYKQDIHLINKIYESFITDNLNDSLNKLITITNKDLIKEKNKCKQTLNLLTLKACLKLANTNNIKAISNNFYNGFLNSKDGKRYQIISSNSISKIKDIFNEVYEEEYLKNNNVKIKQKHII